jgi:sigma-E factor negative regulatory protein RseA
MATEQLLDGLVLDETVASALSALADGELTQQQCDVLCAATWDEPAPWAAWQSYQVIGEALRGERAGIHRAPADFLAGIQAGLATPSSFEVRPAVPLFADLLPQVRGEAANEAVMRWKWVAGVASLAAVAAVSWALVGGIDAADQRAVSQLAQLPAGAPPSGVSDSVPGVQAQPGGALVVVNTGQGRLIRDPNLEQMLAEHRQYGAMSALQMPAGFLRNATYDDSPGQ